ncbi:PspC domain protein [Abiotrophia defectiva ATCC 49176]|uniref:PspC domain protein n=3 Tax=Abiotrophia defectiva TaxID=46125 RepID=W1Q3P1_ABIDE|nr:PspC domain protein [Abiotrophia defectiva ATCC 49176]
MFLGVCAGIADYFGIDPTLVRVVWVISGLLGGVGLFGYLIAAFIMPEA